jgi:hypothetical protein
VEATSAVTTTLMWVERFAVKIETLSMGKPEFSLVGRAD